VPTPTKERHEARAPLALTHPNAMNLEDESFLSAYLDGELDPADRLAVEWAVESSPALAEQLRELGQARAAVVHLPRARAPRDLAPAVVGRLVAARRRAQLGRLVRPGKFALAGAGVLGMAACLFLALIVLHRSTHENTQPSLLSRWFDPASAARTLPIPNIRPLPTPKPTFARAVPAPNPDERVGPPRPARPVALKVAGPTPAEELAEREARARVAGMVGGPRATLRALIVTDAAGASDRVRALLQADARKLPDFGRIAIEPGIVVDPAWPEGADVYPVVLDERGCRPFLDRLRAVFPMLRVEADVAPELLTQLPEVGGIDLFRGVEAAPLGDPPVGLRPFVATKDLEPRSLFAEPALLDLLKDRPTGGTPRGDAPSAPSMPDHRSPLGPAGGESASAGREDRGNVTVLVWVTHPSPR